MVQPRVQPGPGPSNMREYTLNGQELSRAARDYMWFRAIVPLVRKIYDENQSKHESFYSVRGVTLMIVTGVK